MSHHRGLQAGLSAIQRDGAGIASIRLGPDFRIKLLPVLGEELAGLLVFSQHRLGYVPHAHNFAIVGGQKGGRDSDVLPA
jgi:hypothetical protein